MFEHPGWPHFRQLLREMHSSTLAEFMQAKTWEEFVCARHKLKFTAYLADIENHIRNAQKDAAV